MQKLNVGGEKGKGKFPKGWEIVDIRKGAHVRMDIQAGPLPYADNTIDAVYTSHTLEHILAHKIDFVLKEFHRVLKPGCRLRVVVPDIDIAIKAYVEGDIEFLRYSSNPAKMECIPDHPLGYLNCWFHTYYIVDDQHQLGGHVFAYNYEVMETLIKKAGFSTVEKRSYKDCSHIFRKCDAPRWANCSIYVEAEK